MTDNCKIEISGDEATPAWFESLEANPDLEQLTIWSGPLTNDLLKPLSRLTGLRGLCLGEMRVDDGIFEHLRTLRHLEYLNLAYTGIRGNFAALQGLPLRDVRLEGCRLVGDSCAASLAGFPTLRQLEIHMTGLTDAGLEALGELPLEVLWLGPRITDAGLRTVGRMSTLKHLDLCAHMVTDEGVLALGGLGNMEILWLDRCSITDGCVDVLSSLPLLRELNVSHTGVTASGMARLRAALPACRFIEPD